MCTMQESYETTPEHLLVAAVARHAEQDVSTLITRLDPKQLEMIVVKRRGSAQQNLLHTAAQEGQLAIFKLLLSKIADKSHIIKIRDVKDYHVLHLALLGNHLDLVSYILENLPDPKERITFLNDDRKAINCKKCITSPEALQLYYEAYDDQTLKLKVLDIIDTHYSDISSDYANVALQLFKRALHALPKHQRKSYVLHATLGKGLTVTLAQKAIKVAKKDHFKLFDLIINALTESEKDVFCMQGFKYIDSIECLKHLLSHISDKTILLSILVTTFKSKGVLFQRFDMDLFSLYLQTIAADDQEVAELINNRPLDLGTIFTVLEQLQILYDTRVQTLSSARLDSSVTKARVQRNTRGALLLDYLDDSSLFSLRLVSKASREFVSHIQGPYASPHEFVAASTGIYLTADELKDAIAVYFKTMRSTSFHPAILYKMREHSFGVEGADFAEKHEEDLTATGRKYTPHKHHWKINAAWVLAQIHKGRDFVFLSDLVDPYVKRSKNGKYSALTNEIVAAINKGNYQMSVAALNATSSSFFLRRPVGSNNQLYRLKVKDFLNFKNEEYTHAISLVQADLEEHSGRTREWVDKIIQSFTRLNDSHCIETFELIDYLEVGANLDYLSSYLSLFSHKGKSLPQSFLNYYDERRTSSNLQQVLPEIQLNFNQDWTHALAPKLISEKLATAFCNLYCVKEGIIASMSSTVQPG